MHCPSHHKPVLGVCLLINCTHSMRLLCFECILQQIHNGHNEMVVEFQALDKLDKNFEFKEQDINKPQVKEVTEKLIDDLFNDLKVKVNETLDQTKILMKTKLQVIRATFESQNAQMAQITSAQTGQNIHKIKILTHKFLKQQLNSQQYNTELNHLLNHPQSKEQQPKIFNFEQENFKQLSKAIIEDIKNLSNILTNAFQHPLSFTTTSMFVNLNEDKLLGMQSIKFECNKPAMIYSDHPLQFGVYQLRLRIDKPMEGHICIGLIPDELKDKWTIKECSPNINLNGSIQQPKNVRKSRGSWNAVGLKSGDVILVTIDMQRGMFSMTDGHNESCEYTLILSSKIMRVYIFDYDGRNNEFTLLRCGRIA